MSIRQDKTTRLWVLRARIYDEDGNVIKEIKRSTFETKKDAQEFERKLHEARNVGMETLKFEDVAKHYLEAYQARNKLRSYYDTNHSISMHILPFFAKKNIHNIKAKDIIDWQTYMLKKNNYKPKYLQKIHVTLSSVFNHAIRYFNLDRNPCSIVGNFKNKTKKEMLFWTVDEFNSFMESVDKLQDYVMFYTLFWTGMRKGEMLALQWKDIKLKTGQIKISKTLNRYGNHGWELTTPKTEGSIRTISVITPLKDLLQQLYDIQKTTIGFNQNYFVFRDVIPLSAATLDRIYNSYIAKSTVKRIRIHDFRHSYAAALIHNGVDIMLLAQMLGHTSREQVFETYGHLYPDRQSEVLEILEKCVKNVSFENRKPAKPCGSAGSENMVPKVGLEPTRFPVRF